MTDATKIRFLQRWLIARNERNLANLRAQNAVMRARIKADNYRETVTGLPNIFRAHCHVRHGLEIV